MKARNHKSYEGFPEKMISHHSKEYTSAMGGFQQDAYQGAKPSEKIAVANAMSKHHGVGERAMTPARRAQIMKFQKAGSESRRGKKGGVMKTVKKAALLGAAAYGAGRLGGFIKPGAAGRVVRGVGRGIREVGRMAAGTGAAASAKVGASKLGKSKFGQAVSKAAGSVKSGFQRVAGAAKTPASEAYLSKGKGDTFRKIHRGIVYGTAGSAALGYGAYRAGKEGAKKVGSSFKSVGKGIAAPFKSDKKKGKKK